jgi:hypothetical protein
MFYPEAEIFVLVSVIVPRAELGEKPVVSGFEASIPEKKASQN